MSYNILHYLKKIKYIKYFLLNFPLKRLKKIITHFYLRIRTFSLFNNLRTTNNFYNNKNYILMLHRITEHEKNMRKLFKTILT